MFNEADTSQSTSAMGGDPQNQRFLKMYFPHEDGPDVLMLPNQLIASENLSQDFRFQVVVLSDDANINLKDVQGRMVTIELVRHDGTLRYFNGYVFEFQFINTDGGFAQYQMVLKPWLSYLAYRKDNYNFLNKTVRQQTEDVFADYAKLTDWNSTVSGTDDVMTYACQFDETDYNYLHRRWEMRGWHYHWEHRKDGHTLVLGNNSLNAKPIEGSSQDIEFLSETGSTDDNGIWNWKPVRKLTSTKVALSSFDFKKPSPVLVDIPTLNQQGDVPELEVYHYTGHYGFQDSGEGDALARQHMEAIEADGKYFVGYGNNRYLVPGRWFHLTGYFDDENDADHEYLVLDVQHTVTNNYLSGTPSEYKNKLRCIRKKIPWRPMQGSNSKNPKIYGLQTAIVVGPKGQEIHTDNMARIKIQFHWDREGQYDERSSAWVRVSQPWAGKGWGSVAIPRIGQEVIVSFMDGNPDRPIVMGSVYNADQPAPYTDGHMMGFKSNSSPGGGGHSEMVIHDHKGKELINIHGQKDMVTTVLNNKTTTVKGPAYTIEVPTGKQSTVVKKDIFVLSETANITHIAKEAYDIKTDNQGVTITANTHITLHCGGSTIVMTPNGINITATKVDINT